MKNLPANVFHYTDAQGFLEITSHKKIWATCIEFLNDEKEFRHCLDLAGHLSQRFVKDEDQTTKIRCEKFKDILKRLWAMYIFSASFSARGDLLSQWRGYCGSGNGYNIGFDTEKLQKYCDAKGYVFKPCIYDRSEQIELLLPTIERLFNGDFDNQEIPVEEERIIKACDHAAYTIRDIAPFMKDEAFQEEEEWRLVKYITDSNRSTEQRMRAGRTFLIPYTEVDLSNSLDIFSKVTIGPGPFSRDKLSFAARVHLILQKLDQVNPENSKVPYRYW